MTSAQLAQLGPAQADPPSPQIETSPDNLQGFGFPNASREHCFGDVDKGGMSNSVHRETNGGGHPTPETQGASGRLSASPSRPRTPGAPSAPLVPHAERAPPRAVTDPENR